MPLGPGVRYRWKTTKGGKKIRLAFRDNKVIEGEKKPNVMSRIVKNLKDRIVK